MKKYLLAIVLFMLSFCVQSQDLKSIQLNVALNKFDQAKIDVDKYMAVEKNAAKPEGWYYKAIIYNSLGRVPNKPIAESKALFITSLDALKKYAELDPKAPLTAEEKNSTYFNIYYGFYDLGIKTYNDKNFEESYEEFKNALEVHDYVYSKNIIGPNNLKFAAHDTDVVWNLAIIANTLKKKDDALMYYKRVADIGLGDEKYATAYDELVLKYKREKNAELFAKYLALAKKFYPVDMPYWENKEIDFALNGLENEELFSKYEELTKTLPNNYIVFYNYAVDIDKFLGTDASKGKDAAAYRTKIEELFKKANEIKPTIEGNLQLANIYYNKSYELQERASKIKGTKPVEIKAKNDLQASGKAALNDAIPYAEQGVKMLSELKQYKESDKANYKLALEILVNGYKINGNAAKVAEYTKKKEVVDKL